MTRILKTSGFLGLAVMMGVGLHQFGPLSSGQAPPSWMVGAHAHLGVLSIIGIVTGFAVDAVDLAGRPPPAAPATAQRWPTTSAFSATSPLATVKSAFVR